MTNPKNPPSETPEDDLSGLTTKRMTFDEYTDYCTRKLVGTWIDWELYREASASVALDHGEEGTYGV